MSHIFRLFGGRPRQTATRWNHSSVPNKFLGTFFPQRQRKCDTFCCQSEGNISYQTQWGRNKSSQLFWQAMIWRGVGLRKKTKAIISADDIWLLNTHNICSRYSMTKLESHFLFVNNKWTVFNNKQTCFILKKLMASTKPYFYINLVRLNTYLTKG